MTKLINVLFVLGFTFTISVGFVGISGAQTVPASTFQGVQGVQFLPAAPAKPATPVLVASR